MKKFICRAVCVLVVMAFMPLPSQADDLVAGAQAFIEKMEEDAVTSLANPDKPRDDRIAAFRTIFNERFAVRSIGAFTLGNRNWRRASQEERDEFLKLFEDLMVVKYVDQFQNYSNARLNVTKAVPLGNNVTTVHTEMVRPQLASSKPIDVRWRVGSRNDDYKVLDVIVAGTSMSYTMQQEFASIIKNRGSVAGLIEDLRQITSQLNPS